MQPGRVESRRCQRCLSDFVSGATATSSSRASEDEETTTRLSSDLNNDDGAIAEESSKKNGRGRTKLLRALTHT